MSADTVIKVENLSMSYKVRVKQDSRSKLSNFVHPSYTEIKALDDVNFEVHRGDFVGYVGENGAGKSTTIKILLGILNQSAGRISVLNHNPQNDRQIIAQHIGALMGQKSQLWWELPLKESFSFLQKIYGCKSDTDRAWLNELVERLNIAPYLNQAVRELSLGQRMRGEFVAALIHQPQLVFLDEPTLGLDVVTRAAILDLLLEMNEKKKTTVIYTSHEMSDVEKLASRLLLLDHGTVQFDGQPSQFKNQYAMYQRISVQGTPKVPGLAGVSFYQQNQDSREYLLDTRQITINDFLSAVAEANQGYLHGYTVLPTDLEAILLLNSRRKYG